ncbi:uncharacterized protein EMH_0013500 [Eimeria mitis]|uniref:Uncharacterized protein n=1 Tax=Eimeria mitis TaxID=44415 RepID=U6K7A4_9EIME|nr:uncharacterized protein EMH_0013500 [Eimeria mitis]CDJ32731.1 hypothetical protein EMH_0013500 [Eimeria mitis]
MKSKKQSFKLPGLRRCFWCLWLFVALWIVEQQNVYSSRASGKKAAEEDAELETTGGVPDDTMARLHAELAAQQEVTNPQLASLHLTENRCHVIAFTVIFLILIRAVVLRRERERKKKAEEEVKPPEEGPQAEGEERKEAEEAGEEGKPVQEEEPSPELVVSQPEEPAKEIPLPQMPMAQMPVPMPRRRPKAEVPHEKQTKQPEEPGGDGVPDEGFVQRPIARAKKSRKEFVRKAGTPPAAPSQVQPGIEKEVAHGQGPPTGAPDQLQPGIEQEAEEVETVQQPTQPLPVEPTPMQPTLPQLPQQPAPAPAPSVPELGYVEPSVPPEVALVAPHEVPEPVPVMDIQDDEKLRDLRARRNIINSLADVATRLTDELMARETPGIVSTLKQNVETAEKAERQYDLAKCRGDPNLPYIRSDTISVMEACIEGARDGLLQLVNLAKTHGEQVHAYCSQKAFSSDYESMRRALGDMADWKEFKLCLSTLSSVVNTSIALQHENEAQLRILKSIEFLDECSGGDFVKAYAAVAAMNFRMETLQRLSALGSALEKYILQAQKSLLTGKLQRGLVQVEMDANLAQELHVLLSKIRAAPAGQTASGITEEELNAVKSLLRQQYQYLQGIASAKDVHAVAALYGRAQLINEKLKYILQMQKEKLNSALKRQKLSKEDASAVAEAMAKIAETVVDDSEEFWRSAHDLYAQIGGKPEDVLGGASGKALLQTLTTKIKSSTLEKVQGASTPQNVAADAVKKYFAEPWSMIEALARDHWLRAQETLEAAKKGKKYKLDNEGFGSSALDKKTKLRAIAVAKKAETALPLLIFQYCHELSKEIEVYDGIFSSVFMYLPDPVSTAWTAVRQLKDRLDSEKAMARDSKATENIAEFANAMLQTSLSASRIVENEHLTAAVEKARIDLHNTART